jgi:hypothetical protein
MAWAIAREPSMNSAGVSSYLRRAPRPPENQPVKISVQQY